MCERDLIAAGNPSGCRWNRIGSPSTRWRDTRMERYCDVSPWASVGNRNIAVLGPLGRNGA